MSQKSDVAPAKTSGADEGTGWATPPFRAIHDEIDRIFHSLSLPELNWRTATMRNGSALGLRVDVGETDTEIQVSAELPGVAEKDVDVTLEDDILHIRAEKRSDETRQDKTWHIVERSYGRLERAIRVPKGVDPAAVRANFTNGVLTVTLPKPLEAAKAARKIAVRAG